MSTNSNHCPRCGTPLPGDAPKGLCPRCLSAMNLATETVLTGADAVAAQPPLTPDELAPHFPQLEILECLGRGGMGVVYKARQKSLNRFVALKLLAPERVTDAKFAEHFTREAHALAALNHAHIVTVYDFGQAGGFYFLLMEFVDGVNLRQLLQAKKLTPEEALAVIPPLCDALQYAHEHGIVHRDIKPANLLLDKNGRVKIADFGIAKMVGDHSSVGLAESQPAGTPQYMAPEQKDHQRTDHRADIYSLGVVLYEMLTGELPADKLQPPSRKVQIDVRLDEIVLRALEKTPELRYQTAGEMRTQVETVVATPNGGGREAAHTASPPRSLKVCTSTLTTPAEIGNLHGQFFLGRTRGQLILDDRQLTHSRAGLNTVIPLTAIRDLSIGRYPRSANPAGIGLLSVTYEEDGQRKQVLLSPVESWFGLPSTWNARIAEWFAAIREAVIAATGRAPATTPASELGVPRGSFWPIAVFASLPILIGTALGPVLTTSHYGYNSIMSGPGRIAVAAFAIAVVSFLILRWFFAGWNRPAAWGGSAHKDVKWGVGVTLLITVLSVFTFIGVRALKVRMAMQALPEPTTTRAIKQQNEKPDVSFAASNLEDEIIRLARERLEQTRQLYQAKHVSLSQVDEAEGELALAEARGDLVKRAEARLTMATKYLERIEGVHRTGNISEAEYNQAKQRKLEAELELQRARTTAFPKAEKNSGAAVVTRSFPLHHRLASETSDDLRQILSGKPGHEAKPSADNQELRVTAPPEEMSRVVALELSYRQFDQTPHSGWRVLAQDEKRFREAAALIEAYLLHDGLDASERVNLHFHAAQCLASAGDAKSVLDALGHLKQARYTAEPPDAPLRWNDYVGATEAFLKGDLDALKAARERIAAGPKLNGMPANLDVVDRLIARFGQPYRQAYLSEPEDAGRTVEAPGK